MKSREIKNLLRKGIKSETEHFKIIHDYGNDSGTCAIIIPKRCGNAVSRNKLKRRIRDIHHHMKAPESIYILKKGVELPGYREMVREIVKKSR